MAAVIDASGPLAEDGDTGEGNLLGCTQRQSWRARTFHTHYRQYGKHDEPTPMLGVERVPSEQQENRIMLNQQIDPQTLTREQFEKHVDALQVAIAKHFHVNTQKKGKLRDVAAMTLFGFESGYQQALAHFYQPGAPIPQPEARLDLPGEVTLNVRSDLSEYIVFGPSEYEFGQRQHGDFIHAVIDEFGEYVDREMSDQDVVCQHDEGSMTTGFSRSQVVRQLHHDYVVHEVLVRMPDIGKYGISPDAHPEHARDLLIELCLIPESTTLDEVNDLLTTSDSGDDGAYPILITLRSKRLIEKRLDCEPVLDALIKRLNSDGEIAKGIQDAQAMTRIRTLLSELVRMRADHPYLLKTDKAAFWQALSELDPEAAQQIREAYDL